MAPYDSTYGSTGTPSSRPASKKSQRSQHSTHTSEATPLLARDDREDEAAGDDVPHESQATSSLRRSLHDGNAPTKSTRTAVKRRWASLTALLVLCVVVVLIMVFGFLTPRTVEQYSKQAATFEPSRLSIDSFTTTGIRARVEGEFYMDPDKVSSKSTRDFGKFATYIARKAKTSATTVNVRLPNYSDDIFGSAKLPSITVDLRAGKRTQIDILTDIEPGSKDPIRRVAKDWMDGNLKKLTLQATANVKISSGLIHLPGHEIVEDLIFRNDGSNNPDPPQYNITKINIHENTEGKGIAADVSISLSNDYPIELDIPPLRFGILIDNCLPTDPYLRAAEAITQPIHVEPRKTIKIRVSGFVKDLSKELTDVCPNTRSSPLDALLGHYINGDTTIIYVQGDESPEDTPDWIGDLTSAITAPVPLEGHTFDNLIKNFSLTDTHFSLPDPDAEPGTPGSNPKISTDINVLVGLPEEMNFPVNIDRVKAHALIFYEGDELGILDLGDWQKANTTRLEDEDGPALKVSAHIKDAPVQITSQDTFSKVVQKIIFGKETVHLKLKAEIDAKLKTALGGLAVRKIPAEGTIPIKPMDRGGKKHGDGGKNSTLSELKPHIGNLSIISTTRDSITLTTYANFTNPTNYTATIPYADLHIFINDLVMGHVTAKNLHIRPGQNENVLLRAVYQPKEMSGDDGVHEGLEAISRYVSGMNVTLGVKTHKDSFPAVPALGGGLADLNFTFPAPRAKAPDSGHDPDDPDNDDPDRPTTHFIEYTEMHLLSSSANFHLLSPLNSTTLFINWLNATSTYQNHTVGHILYDLPFEVPPGRSVSPKLPVDWSIGSVGYDAVKKAVGGTLKLDAYADARVQLGAWVGQVWILGHGVGAKVRLL